MALFSRYLTALIVMAPTILPANAACPVELSTYGDRDKVAEINFTPAQGGATVANSFRMLLEKDIVLDGIVQWTEGESRSHGMLTYKCPEGDVTGEEYAACTVWQGVIYSVDEQGAVGLMPAQGQPAPKRLVFTDLGPSLQLASAFGKDGLSKVPFDVFEINGCQE
jgi:hypothetical protein